jgi:diadenylate cyclase
VMSLKGFQEMMIHFAVSLRWQDALDLALVSLLFFRLFSFMKETRTAHLLRGLLLLVLTYFIANTFLDLRILTSVLQNAATLVIVAIPVVFQPELRRALSEIGRRMSIFRNEKLPGKKLFNIVNILVNTTQELAENRTGALIVIERQQVLDEFFNKSGYIIDAEISKELLLTIFYDGTPMHDGAVILRGNRLLAASVVLPVIETMKSPAGIYWGTRHRAALGVSDVSDASCIVVSEETGSISLVEQGKIHRNLSEETLERKLLEIFQMQHTEAPQKISRFFEWLSQYKRPLPKPILLALSYLRQFSDRVLFDLRFVAVILSLVWGFAIGMGTGPAHAPVPLDLEQHTRVLLVPIVPPPLATHTLTLEPPQTQLVISGRSEILKAITSQDLEISLQIRDIKTAEQTVPISVLLPQDVQLRELSPRLVKVRLKPRTSKPQALPSPTHKP